MYPTKHNTGTDKWGPSEWYALYTRHQHEKVVAESLSKNGFEVFLPLYDVVRQWKDRTKRLSLPLFSCYVFLRGGLERRLSILSTPGVYSILGIAGQPAAIPQVEIDAIRKVTESSLRVEPHPFLRCGDWVRVTSGPLTGVEGILVRKKNLSRLVLSAELLEKSVAVEVDAFRVARLVRNNVALPASWSGTQLATRERTTG